MPPDWAIWTYLFIVGLMSFGSYVLVYFGQAKAPVSIVDYIGLAFTLGIPLCWLSGLQSVGYVSGILLIAIIVLANFEGAVRYLQHETWETEEEAETIPAFTYGFVTIIIAPPIYLISLMIQRGLTS